MNSQSLNLNNNFSFIENPDLLLSCTSSNNASKNIYSQMPITTSLNLDTSSFINSLTDTHLTLDMPSQQLEIKQELIGKS